MRYFLILLISSAVTAEEKSYDPSKPVDAVMIIDALTKQMVLPRDQAQALTISLQTLMVLAEKDKKLTPKAKE